MDRSTLGIVLFAGLIPLAAGAQDFVLGDIVLEDIVVTANRTPSDLARTGVSVAVVTADDLAASGDASVATYLARLPGISFSQQGPFGNAANLRIRGADQRYISVLVDGVRVGDPSGVQTSFDFGQFLSADVGRIEVLRGSQSALYGGSAVGGVVSIASARPLDEGISQSVAVEAGSYATFGARYGLAQKSGPLELTFGATHFRTSGYSAAASGTEDDGAVASRLSGTLRYAVSDTVTLGGSVFGQSTEQEYDGFDPNTFQLVDALNEQTRTEAGARLFAEVLAGNTNHVFEVTGYRIGRDYDQPADGPSSFDGDRITLGWQATTTVNQALTLVYGADTMKETARYTNLGGGSATSRISGAFGQAIFAASDRLDLTATARIDDNSDFGSFSTGRLALAWRPGEGTVVRAAYATGFRAPSIDERFGDYPGFGFAGNPDLTPEESRSYEVGVEQTLAGGAVLSATLFRLEIGNLVAYAPCPFTDPANFDFSCQPGTINTLENLPGNSVRKGVELSAEVPLGDRFTLGAGYTYTDARRPGGARLGLVPVHDLTLSLDAEVSDRLNASLSLEHVAGRLDDFGSGPLEDYTVLNAGVRYDLNDRAEAYLRIENITDKDYQQTSGYAASGRAVYAGLRATF